MINGTKVKVLSSGKIGEVSGSKLTNYGRMYKVSFVSGRSNWFLASELEVLP